MVRPTFTPERSSPALHYLEAIFPLKCFNQSILAVAKLLTAGFAARLLARRMAGRLYLLCLRSRLRATITGTEDLVTR